MVGIGPVLKSGIFQNGFTLFVFDADALHIQLYFLLSPAIRWGSSNAS